jgi:hypothetical protein
VIDGEWMRSEIFTIPHTAQVGEVRLRSDNTPRRAKLSGECS